MVPSQMKELLLQSLEHARGGLFVYRTALDCALDDQLHVEWEKYFDHTENHISVLTRVCIALGLDPGIRTPGCEIVHHTGNTLVVAMKRAVATGDAQAAELVACECVVLTETSSHLNWELLCACADALDHDSGRLLAEACVDIAVVNDKHLCRSKDWCRELWLKSLGLKAVIPPPARRVELVKEATTDTKARSA